MSYIQFKNNLPSHKAICYEKGAVVNLQGLTEGEYPYTDDLAHCGTARVSD